MISVSARVWATVRADKAPNSILRFWPRYQRYRNGGSNRGVPLDGMNRGESNGGSRATLVASFTLTC